MLQVFANANFRLMWGTKWFFMAFSALVLTVAIAAMATRGFNLGIDFAGGTAVQVKFREPARAEDLRAALEARNLGDISIQQIGEADDHEFLIRAELVLATGQAGGSEGGEISSEILEALRTSEDRAAARGGRIDLNTISEAGLAEWLAARLPAPSPAADGGDGAPTPAAIAAAIVRQRNARGGLFGDVAEVGAIAGVPPAAASQLAEHGTLGRFALRGVDFVGPTAGKELLRNTGFAILGSVLGVLVYVWFRFHKWAWGIAAVIALIHDVTIAAGAMAITGKEFSLPVVAALLTILGYSINDTIVIFDRIRENLRLYREHDFEEVVNASV
ncbi:MAG: protein translocase subunit SecF, partial [Acidobacteria bacterium]|nr:protein translocase subunit SecF [Acidobacteriota bacterium]